MWGVETLLFLVVAILKVVCIRGRGLIWRILFSFFFSIYLVNKNTDTNNNIIGSYHIWGRVYFYVYLAISREPSNFITYNVDLQIKF